MYDIYVAYLKNAGLRDVPVEWFRSDWEPIGDTVMQEMEDRGLVTVQEGTITLAAGENIDAKLDAKLDALIPKDFSWNNYKTPLSEAGEEAFGRFNWGDY